MAYRHPIGATFRLAGQLTLSGQAQDMSAWTPSAILRGPLGCHPLDAAWLDAGQGQLQLHVPASEQTDWQPGRYAVEVRLTRNDGEVLISGHDDVELVRALTPPFQP